MAIHNSYGALGTHDVIEVVLSCHTDANAVLDVIAAPQELTTFFRHQGGVVSIHSLVTLDKDDQGQNIDLLFLNATGSIGAESAAFAPTDAVAQTIIGSHSVTDWKDATNSQYASEIGNRLVLKAANGSDSVWIAAVCREGTPTYSATGLVVKLGIERH